MRNMIAFVGLFALATGAGAQAIDPAKARARLKTCGPEAARIAELPDRNWQPTQSVLQKHIELRKTSAAAMLSAPTMVTVYASGGHHSTTTYSLVLTRDRKGAWHGSAVGQTVTWIVSDKPEAIPPREWDLTPVDGKRLDAILVDPCLYAEPATSRDQNRAPSIGALETTIETITPRRHHIAFNFRDELDGLAKTLVELATPPRS